MGSLRIYRIEEKYIRFLRSRDDKVLYNKGRRPYVGVVLFVGSYQYFVPMESPKPHHQTMKSGPHIVRIDNGKLGILGFNNMVPVPDSALIEFDISDESDEKYADLLRRQAYWIQRHKGIILGHASNTYYKTVQGNNQFYAQICCDFKKLEKACTQYDPNRKQKRKLQPSRC